MNPHVPMPADLSAEELTDFIVGGVMFGEDYLAELLRRERDRCAAVCDDVASDVRKWSPIAHPLMASKADGAGICASAIRELR